VTDWVRACQPAPQSRVARGILPYLRSGWAHTYPTYLARGEGALVWDEQGRSWIDWVSGRGAVTLGHACKAVDEAAAERARRGFLFGACPREYEQLAEKLALLLPCAEKSIFAKNGSDAVEIAICLARTVSGRDLVASAGYHGWHERLRPGASDRSQAGAVVDFGYDLARLEALAEREGSRLAAILVSPEPAFFDAELLVRAADIARSTSALLIVDEVRCGFRLCPGGAHELWGVVPDLIVLSKGLANGYPLSAVTGRADVLDASADTFVFGTYYAEAVALAAANACLDVYERDAVVSRIWQAGRALLGGLDAIFRSEGVSARPIGPPPMPQILFEDEPAEATFYARAAERGVLFFQEDGQCPSAAHGPGEIERTLEVCAEVARDIRRDHQGNRKRSLPALDQVKIGHYAERRMIHPHAVDFDAFCARLDRSW
jgi:glutamate-1-semialdehyde 2,1-aminomutase